MSYGATPSAPPRQRAATAARGRAGSILVGGALAFAALALSSRPRALLSRLQKLPGSTLTDDYDLSLIHI